MALLKRFALLIRHGDESASRDRNLTDTLMQANDTDPARLGAGLTLLRHIDLRTTTSPMKMPCLVIHGTHDAVVPLAAAEWLQHRKSGLLNRADLAWSRQGAEKVYVQHKLAAAAAEVWQWLQQGAHIYVCGDAGRMARDVEQVLLNIIADQGRMSDDDAADYLNDLREEKRYQRDVY